MIIEFEINGARVIVSGDNLMVNVTDADATVKVEAATDIPSPSEIKALRRSRGYTQGQFAALLRVSQGSVSKWEAGSEAPKARPAFVMRKMINRLASSEAAA